MLAKDKYIIVNHKNAPVCSSRVGSVGSYNSSFSPRLSCGNLQREHQCKIRIQKHTHFKIQKHTHLKYQIMISLSIVYSLTLSRRTPQMITLL